MSNSLTVAHKLFGSVSPCASYRLRPMTESDLEQVFSWRNSERVRKYMYTDHLISYAEHRAWFSGISKDPGSIHLIFEFETRPVGVVNITQIDTVNRRCHWGFYLGVDDLPKGVGSAMGFCALQFMFSELSMRKITGEVLSFNASSLRFHERLGFTEEGIFKQHVIKSGVPVDVVVLAIFDCDWNVIKPSLAEHFFSHGGVSCEK